MRSRPGFTGGGLDRADRFRNDAAAIERMLGDWRGRLLMLDALDPSLDDAGGLIWTTLADLPADAEPILLGLEGDRPYFTCVTPDMRPVRGRSPRIMQMLGLLREGDAARYAQARSVVDWHVRHRFCAECGSPTCMIRAGWARTCDNCAAEHFPRTDPVVIMIAEHDGRALLGRGPGWPPGRYSALAGFVEVGESVEEAVAREIWEETGVRVRDVEYVASQPWPFASSLMIACTAVADDDALTIDINEIEDAIWVSRADCAAALAGDADAPFLAPPPYAIAHTLLTAWVGND